MGLVYIYIYLQTLLIDGKITFFNIHNTLPNKLF